MPGSNERERIEHVVDALDTQDPGDVDRDTLTAVVEADFRRYSAARIKEFVPLFVERDIRARLRKHRLPRPNSR